MRTKKVIWAQIALALMLSVFFISAGAENIVLPIASQGDYLGDIKHPSRGQKKSSIIRQYGEPITKGSPVGSPPISHWDYPDFSVYFEHDTVIRTVLKHRRLNQKPQP
jgi:hypothetical protein